MAPPLWRVVPYLAHQFFVPRNDVAADCFQRIKSFRGARTPEMGTGTVVGARHKNSVERARRDWEAPLRASGSMEISPWGCGSRLGEGWPLRRLHAVVWLSRHLQVTDLEDFGRASAAVPRFSAIAGNKAPWRDGFGVRDRWFRVWERAVRVSWRAWGGLTNWRKIPGRGQAADQDQPRFAAVGAGPGRRGLGAGDDDAVDRLGGQRLFALEQEHLADAAGQRPLRGVPEAVVADLVEPLGQDMLAEAAQELVTGHGAGPPLPGAAVALLVLEGDRVVVDRRDPAVGDGSAEDVAGQVIEHGLFAFAPRNAVNDPGLAPDFRWNGGAGQSFGDGGAHFAAHQLAQRLDRDQEAGANRRAPVRAIGRDATAGDQAVDMRVVIEPLGPGVQHGQDADGAADIARVTGERDDRRGGGGHQKAVGVALMAAHHVAQFGRHGNGDMEVRGRQHLGAAGFEPMPGLVGMALGAAPVATAVVGIDLGAAGGAAPEMSAQLRGPAGRDVGQGAPMRGKHRRAVTIEVGRTETANDVRDVDHDGATLSEADHDLVEEASQRRPGRLGQVGIDGGRGDAGVAEQDLDDPGIDAVLHQPGRITVPQHMRRRPAGGEAHRGDRGAERAEQDAGGDRLGADAIGKEEPGVAVHAPEGAQVLVDWLRQRNQPLLVAFADDAQDHPRAVNRGDFESDCLRDAQATRIHQREAALVDRVRYAAKEPADLIIGQRLRQPLLLGLPNLFFPNKAQARFSVWQ